MCANGTYGTAGARLRIIALLVALIVAVAGADRVMGAGAPHRVADAVQARDVAALPALLKSDSVNAPQADGTTALHWAAYWDDSATVDRLLRAGASVNAANRYGVTPLFLASTNGNAVVMRQLLQAGADADTVSGANRTVGEGEPALLAAARTGSVDAVRALLDYGADVTVVESWHQQNALMWAAAANAPAAVEVLLDAGADVTATSEGGFTALHYAARIGAIDAARVLIGAGADVNKLLADRTSPLMLAMINARYELASMLLDRGANANDDSLGFTPLHQLMWSYHPNVSLMPPGPPQTGDLDAMGLARVLLAHHANPNAPMTRNPSDGYRTSMNRMGATPLMMAARVPDVELMRLLLDHGADPALETADHTTLLMIASGYGYQAGESPESKPGALLEAVKMALDLGADVNAANDRGYTALHCAVIRESNELIQFLVDNGADLYAKTKEEDPRFPGKGQGKTPLEVAGGQMVIASFKYYPEQAAYLRKIMGLPEAAVTALR
jgi:ankyrin repeat protein